MSLICVNTAQSLLRISESILYNSMNADKQMAVQYAEDQRTKEEMTDQMGKGKSSTHCLEKQRTEEEVDASITDLTDQIADDGHVRPDLQSLIASQFQSSTQENFRENS